MARLRAEGTVRAQGSEALGAGSHLHIPERAERAEQDEQKKDEQNEQQNEQKTWK